MSKNEKPNDNEIFSSIGKHVYDTPLEEEASKSFLEYSYSVITSRALPDARDGLKPVHRRILFSMSESGLRPDHSFVKSARVVGDVMGKYHPHGDSAIYEALVRLSQDFNLNTPLISGHGNFGSPNDGPAASRYTECRLSKQAMLLVNELDENTVDFDSNYDGSMTEPTVLPAAYPNLLVNGSSGIAVGMATNMIPHNLNEVVEAARFLIKKPAATLEELMEIVPGPDLPTGGILIGLDEVKRAYSEGKGSVRIRAKAEIMPLEGSRGRSTIVITELPYLVGTEKIIEKIKDELAKKRLQGISDVKDLSDRKNGLRLIVETKTGVNAQVLLNELYRYTPLETSFGISNLTLVKGQPQTLGLKQLLEVFLEHRYLVIRRRTQFRLDKAEARKHIVDGLLIALDAIDEVVKVIKASPDTASARTALCETFNLSEIQAGHILDMPLRRLVSLEIESLRKELDELNKRIAEYTAILADDKKLKSIVDSELKTVSEEFGQARKTELMPGDLDAHIQSVAQQTNASVEIKDEATEVYLSTSGLIARLPVESETNEEGNKKVSTRRLRHDGIAGSVLTSTRSQILAITNKGNAYKVNVIEIASLPSRSGRVGLRGSMPTNEIASMDKSEKVVGIAPLEKGDYYGIAMATASGLVKIASFDFPLRNSDFPIIGLKTDDVLVAAYPVSESDHLVLISSDASLLTFAANKIRAQGRSGGGVAGMKIAADASLIALSTVPDSMAQTALVGTLTGHTVKVTPFAEFPAKGRGTGGVRSHKLLKNETELTRAGVYPDLAIMTDKGEPVDLPKVNPRRDGSGEKLEGDFSFGRTFIN